jgi:hypothetical protein
VRWFRWSAGKKKRRGACWRREGKRWEDARVWCQQIKEGGVVEVALGGGEDHGMVVDSDGSRPSRVCRRRKEKGDWVSAFLKRYAGQGRWAAACWARGRKEGNGLREKEAQGRGEGFSFLF